MNTINTSLLHRQVYTVIAYDLPAGGHHVESLAAISATEAAVQLRIKLGRMQHELEIVGVMAGVVEFVLLDHRHVALAPFSLASP